MLEKGMYYICSPLSAATPEGIRENMLKARCYMELINRRFSCRAIAPHAYLPELLDDENPRERKLGIEFGLTLLSWCRGMIVCGSKISSGMKTEIQKALEMQIPVFVLLEEAGQCHLVSFREECAYEMQIPQKSI